MGILILLMNNILLLFPLQVSCVWSNQKAFLSSVRPMRSVNSVSAPLLPAPPIMASQEWRRTPLRCVFSVWGVFHCDCWNTRVKFGLVQITGGSQWYCWLIVSVGLSSELRWRADQWLRLCAYRPAGLHRPRWPRLHHRQNGWSHHG